MKNMREASHHLYDNVFSSVDTPLASTIEDSILHRKRTIELPPEFPPFKIKSQGKRPRSSISDSSSIFTNMSTPYDISHRLQTPKNKSRKPVQKELDPNEEPTFVNLNPPKGKFWISEKRVEAQKLQEQLDKLSKEAEQEAKKAESDFDATTISLEKNLEAHQKTLDAFTTQADENNPERGVILHRIADYYRKLADEIPRIKADFAERYEIATKDLEKAEIERKSLEEERNKSLSAIERQNRIIEGLKQQIKDFQTRCANAEAQLRDAMNDKTAMARSSQTNQLKLIEIGKQIVEKRAQQQKLSSLVDTLSKDISTRTAELRGATSELQDIEKELEKVRKEITSYRAIADDRTKLCQQLRNTPLRTANQAGRSQIAIQCNRVPKRQSPKKTGTDSTFTSSIDGQSQFAQVKSDMTQIQQKLTPQEGGKIAIKNFNDLSEVRETILKNNGIFDFSVDSITKAHGGYFDFKNVNEDESRIFAKWLMRRVMSSALKSRSVKDASTQTDDVDSDSDKPTDINGQLDDVGQIRKEFKVTDKTPKPLVSFIKNSRFVNLLQTDESDRKPRSLEWLIHSIRSIYDEKTVDDRTAVRDNEPIMSLPEYLLIWAFRQFGKPDLIQKGCWDIFITSHFYMQRFLEVTLFVRFLDEVFTIDQLSFFLNCRVWILQRCVTFPVMHDDLNLYFTETYLTASQVDEFFASTFPNTEKELLDDITVRGCACCDNIRLKASDAANIPMMRILELALGEQQDEQVRRLRRMLAFYRPVPRMTLKRFSLFVKNMIPNIDPNMVDSLYRSGLVKNSLRVDIEHEQFILMFKKGKKIVPSEYDKDDISCEEFAEFSPLFSMVLNRWKQFYPFLQRMMNNLSPDSYEGANSMVSEIRHQIFQLLESKVTFDGVLLYQNYHRVLQVVMRTCLRLNLPDPLSFSKQVADFQEILMKKFQTVLAINESNEDEI